MSDDQKSCLLGAFNYSLTDTQRLAEIQCAFFAQGNDPRLWLHGWYPQLAQAQIQAAIMISGDFYKKAGGKPFLIVQPTEDFIAPPDKSGKVLKRELGDQVTYREVEHAGHAVTSEQPDQVAEYLIQYFGRNQTRVKI